MRMLSGICALPMVLALGCGHANKTDLRTSSEGDSQRDLSLAAAATATTAQTATATASSTSANAKPYCAPIQANLAFFGNATSGLVQQYASLRAIPADDFGGYRVKAMADITAAEAAINAAIAYVQINGECGPVKQVQAPAVNPLKLPASAGDYAKTLLAVGDQLNAINNILNVSIVERDFGGHRAEAAADVATALSDLQVAIDFEACEEVPARTFSQVAATLTSVSAALAAIPQGDFGGWKVKAVADLGNALTAANAAAAISQTECAKPDQSNATAITDPLKLPTRPGVATATIVAQADRLTSVVNLLNVTITERDFNGLRATSAADVVAALNDLQDAIIYEACQEGSTDAACALSKPAS